MYRRLSVKKKKLLNTFSGILGERVDLLLWWPLLPSWRQPRMSGTRCGIVVVGSSKWKGARSEQWERERERISRIKTRWTQYPLFPYRVRSSTVRVCVPRRQSSSPPSPCWKCYCSLVILLSPIPIFTRHAIASRLSINLVSRFNPRSINICLIVVNEAFLQRTLHILHESETQPFALQPWSSPRSF